MYLTRLEILGFKSFAQKVVLKFNDGLTAIVGPNGCGKSNIVDAIRWVLGEQRPSVLRCERMENLIFGGTSTRKPLSLAEVSLYLENNKNILPTEYSEVKITRRLTRSGESEYLLNNQPVRLMDIVNLFADTGMGADAYSVIELKMVEQILNENPEERRRLFEEAAGIKKYKSRRRAALRKLDTTHQELNRLNDIIAEVQKKVNSLSRQVGKARRYHQFKQALSEKQLQLYRVKLRSLEEALVPLNAEYDEVSHVRDRLNAEIHNDESKLAAQQTRAVDLEQAFRRIANQLYQQEEAIRNLRGDIQLLKQRRESLEERVAEHRQEVAAHRERQKKQQQERAELIEQQKRLEADAKRAERNYHQAVEQQNEAEAAYQKLREQHQAYVQRHLNQLQAAEEVRETYRVYQARLQELLQRLARKAEANQRLEEQRRELEQGLGKAEADLAALVKDEEIYRRELEQVNRSQEANAVQAQALRDELNRIQGELETARSRQEFLANLIRQHQGFSESVQYVLSHRDRFPGLLDTLANLIDCPEQVRPALERLLGEKVGTLVVRSVNDARQVLAAVKEAKKGSVSVVPLELVPREDLPDHGFPGSVQPLLAQVNGPPELKPLLARLLAGACLVEHLEQALSLRQQFPQATFLTASGHVLFPWGEITVGRFGGDIPIIGRGKALEQASRAVDALSEKLNGLNDQLEQLAREQRALHEKRAHFQQYLAEVEKQKHQAEKKRDQQLFEKTRLDELLEEGRLELADWENQKAELERQLQELSPRVEQFDLALNRYQAEEQEHQQKLRALEDELKQRREQVQQCQLKMLNLSAREKELRQQLHFLDKSEQESAAAIARRETEIEQMCRQIEQLNQEIADKEATLEQTLRVRDGVEKEKNAVEKDFQELKSQIQLFEQEVKKKQRLLNQARERLQQLALQRREYQVRIDSIREQIREQFGQDAVTSPADLDETLSEQQLQEEIEALQKKLASLGEVNPLAIREHEEEKKRLEFLQEQQADVLEAEKRLLETIRKLNKTARSQFLETFNQINENFKRVFHEFFDAGSAELYLEEGKDPLEASVEIAVTMKGKKLRSLSLLSAGEKTLTAISMLFAIYLVKPSPFCILDEVDAPLDDVNIGRFLRALKAFSKDTQFILVTHNKKTMEATETLYGVTMEEPGVSKIVSVRVN
ncbi:MAG: chromosome segregation protein SMC [Calditrichaeota bacterium]|nr:MAG: chromosome segregation protein SMC [Calditrichota bacterium]